jgi:RNA polymerase sigma-70 factor (ECF subfamily)
MADEDELAETARLPSARAVATLFDEHWVTAWRAAYAVTGRSDLADDAAQDAFVSAIRSLDSFERNKPFAPWIAKIAVNRARDLLRAERRREAARLDDTVQAPTRADVTPLLVAVAAVPVEQREAVVLHHVLGFNLREVAEVVGVPEGTAASRLGRGIAQLRETTEAEHA